jgi:hypothetical protein
VEILIATSRLLELADSLGPPVHDIAHAWRLVRGHNCGDAGAGSALGCIAAHGATGPERLTLLHRVMRPRHWGRPRDAEPEVTGIKGPAWSTCRRRCRSTSRAACWRPLPRWDSKRLERSLRLLSAGAEQERGVRRDSVGRSLRVAVHRGSQADSVSRPNGSELTAAARTAGHHVIWSVLRVALLGRDYRRDRDFCSRGSVCC